MADWVGLTRHMLLVVVNVTLIKFAIVTDTILLNILSVFIFFFFQLFDSSIDHYELYNVKKI